MDSQTFTPVGTPNINTAYTAPTPSSNTPPANTSSYGNGVQPNNKKIGPIIVVLVVILVLIIAGLYYFASRLNNTNITVPPAENTNTEVVAPVNTEVQPVTGTADDVTSLEADLNKSTTGLDNQNF